MSLQDHKGAVKNAEKLKARKRVFAIAAPIAIACAAFAIVLAALITPGLNSQTLSLSEAEIGSTVFFGSYEQDNDISNGKEEIEWIVLAKEVDKALVISRFALDCGLYDTAMSDVTWETCALRKWLNGPFLNAFSAEERDHIIDTAVTADKNPSFSTPPGNDTVDKVFLLSITEVNSYFGSDEARKCEPTEYAKAQGVWTSSRFSNAGGAACWWLRSPGSLPDHAAIVLVEGSVETDGRGVFNILGGIRPTMWIGW